jgi:hypothetical protein
MQSLHDALGSDVVFLVRGFAGPPPGLNLRNLLWHGFMSPREFPEW